MRARPKEGSAQARAFNFRPPDPSWASESMLRGVRAALSAFDPFVTIWWSPTRRCQSGGTTPGRWRVMEWMPRLSNWTEIFCWETANRRYASPWPIAPIFARLGRAKVRMDVAARAAEEHTERARSAEKAAFYDALDQFAQDMAKRTVGSRATPRSILHATSQTEDGIKRRRAAAIQGMFRGDAKLSNHERFLRDHFAKQAAGG